MKYTVGSNKRKAATHPAYKKFGYFSAEEDRAKEVLDAVGLTEGQVEHTKRPKVRNFDALLEGGLITVDYLMSQKGENKVRDHGYLFKMHPSDFDALFPPSKFHVLC